MPPQGNHNSSSERAVAQPRADRGSRDRKGEGEGRGKLTRNVLLLGLTSLINDVSAELIMAVLPAFIVRLGGGGLGVGLIGGVEESTKSLLSIFAGHWSDRFPRRRPLVAGGYLIASLSRVGLYLVGSWAGVLGLRLLDRVGKGLRTAPRDAIIADSAPQERRGLSFGFHRMMDSAGALLGSLLAYLLYRFLEFDLRGIILLGGLSGALALLPLLGVRERVRPRPGALPRRSLLLGVRGLSGAFILNLSAMMLFALANLSYMFFWLKASAAFPTTERLAIEAPLLMYALFNLVYTLFSTPAGALSDRLGRRRVLLGGYLLFAGVALGFALSGSMGAFVTLFGLYGLTLALIEGNQRAFAADLAAAEERGLALGAFHMGVGLATLVGNLIAGALWKGISPEAALLYGSAVALLSALLFGLIPALTRKGRIDRFCKDFTERL